MDTFTSSAWTSTTYVSAGAYTGNTVNYPGEWLGFRSTLAAQLQGFSLTCSAPGNAPTRFRVIGANSSSGPWSELVEISLWVL